MVCHFGWVRYDLFWWSLVHYYLRSSAVDDAEELRYASLLGGHGIREDTYTQTRGSVAIDFDSSLDYTVHTYIVHSTGLAVPFTLFNTLLAVSSAVSISHMTWIFELLDIERFRKSLGLTEEIGLGIACQTSKKSLFACISGHNLIAVLFSMASKNC